MGLKGEEIPAKITALKTRAGIAESLTELIDKGTTTAATADNHLALAHLVRDLEANKEKRSPDQESQVKEIEKNAKTAELEHYFATAEVNLDLAELERCLAGISKFKSGVLGSLES